MRIFTPRLELSYLFELKEQLPSYKCLYMGGSLNIIASTKITYTHIKVMENYVL